MSDESQRAAELFARLAAIPKATPQQLEEAAKAKAAKRRAVHIERLTRWQGKDAWNLRREASALAIGLDPDAKSLSLLDDSDERCAGVFDLARRSVETKMLAVTSPDAPPEQWMVRPEAFAGWVASRASAIGPSAQLEAFAAVFPNATAADGAGRSAREKFIQSGYTTRGLELAFEAIAELWLPYQEGKRPYPPKEQEVTAFLMARGATSSNESSRIDALIRLDEAKVGGNVASKGSTQKRQKK